MHRKEFWFLVATTVLLGSPLPAAARSVAAYGWESGATKQVAYIATDGDIHELYVQVGGGWAEVDLTQLARNARYPAPQPRPGSPLTGYSWELKFTKQVAYIAADQHWYASACSRGHAIAAADGAPICGSARSGSTITEGRKAGSDHVLCMPYAFVRCAARSSGD